MHIKISNDLNKIILCSLLFLVSCGSPNLDQNEELEIIDEYGSSFQDCLGSETNSIGKGIADSYNDINYQEVMTWFCNGSEFEDIFLALQTAEQTGAIAEELLVMLVDGFTWEEIWLVLGVVD